MWIFIIFLFQPGRGLRRRSTKPFPFNQSAAVTKPREILCWWQVYIDGQVQFSGKLQPRIPPAAHPPSAVCAWSTRGGSKLFSPAWHTCETHPLVEPGGYELESEKPHQENPKNKKDFGIPRKHFSPIQVGNQKYDIKKNLILYSCWKSFFTNYGENNIFPYFIYDSHTY